MDIAFDPSGNAWVTNGFGDDAEDVEKFVASGTSYVYSTTIGTSGSGAGQFAGPTAIAFDSGGNMWISDTLNNRVQKWIASGTTYVYNAQVGSVGTSTNEFESPWGIAFDSGGNMWVVDAGNARVEEFSSSGAYMTTPINTSGFTNTGFGIVIPNGTTTTGTLDSETFDTGVSSGAQLNSVTWQGTAPASTTVGFQFAVSASSTGPWTYAGLDGTSGTMYTGLAGAPIPLSNYPSLKGRYFRYHIILITNGSGTVTPSVQGVSVNWSP
jgi:secreted PhoX family phosphatase